MKKEIFWTRQGALSAAQSYAQQYDNSRITDGVIDERESPELPAGLDSWSGECPCFNVEDGDFNTVAKFGYYDAALDDVLHRLIAIDGAVTDITFCKPIAHSAEGARLIKFSAGGFEAAAVIYPDDNGGYADMFVTDDWQAAQPNADSDLSEWQWVGGHGRAIVMNGLPRHGAL